MNYLKLIEPGALDYIDKRIDETEDPMAMSARAFALSQAISLKRLADALENIAEIGISIDIGELEKLTMSMMDLARSNRR